MKPKELLNKWKAWWSSYSGKRSSHPILAILLSVSVAVVLWFYVQDAESPDYKKTFTGVSVELEGLASDLAVISGGETEVDITLQGKRTDLNRIKVSDLEAYLDLSTVTEAGVYEQSVSVLLPEGTLLDNVFPKTTSLFVDETTAIPVPVTVELGTHTLPADTSVIPTPAVQEITVKGPKTILEQVDRAEIATGDLGEITHSFEKTLEYRLLNADGEPVSSRHLVLPQKNVRVKFSVQLTKTVPLVVKTLHDYWEDDSWRYTVSPSSIQVKGEPEIMAGIDEIAAYTVDEALFVERVESLSERILPSQLELPQGVSLAEVLGDISYSVSVSGTRVKKLRIPLTSGRWVIDPPKVDDETELPYSFDVDVITLQVRGPARLVNQATADDFYFHVDLSSFATPGERDVTVEIIQTDATKGKGKYYAVGEYVLHVTVLSPET